MFHWYLVNTSRSRVEMRCFQSENVFSRLLYRHITPSAPRPTHQLPFFVIQKVSGIVEIKCDAVFFSTYRNGYVCP
jgi:hypothetical protein